MTAGEAPSGRHRVCSPRLWSSQFIEPSPLVAGRATCLDSIIAQSPGLRGSPICRACSTLRLESLISSPRSRPNSAATPDALVPILSRVRAMAKAPDIPGSVLPAEWRAIVPVVLANLMRDLQSPIIDDDHAVGAAVAVQLHLRREALFREVSRLTGIPRILSQVSETGSIV